MKEQQYLKIFEDSLKIQNYYSWKYSEDYSSIEYNVDNIKIICELSFLGDIIKIYDSNDLVHKEKFHHFLSLVSKSIGYIRRNVQVAYINEIFNTKDQNSKFKIN